MLTVLLLLNDAKTLNQDHLVYTHAITDHPTKFANF